MHQLSNYNLFIILLKQDSLNIINIYNIKILMNVHLFLKQILNMDHIIYNFMVANPIIFQTS